MIEIYTDGSYREGIIGWAIVVVRDGVEIARRYDAHDPVDEGFANTKNLAVEHAVLWACEKGHRRVTIFCDTELLVESFNLGVDTGNVYLDEALVWMRDQPIEITLCWVKSHDGTHSNERAHKLARRAVGQAMRRIG